MASLFINRHDCWYWSDHNALQTEGDHAKHSEKLNVCAGIIGNTIIDPLFIGRDHTEYIYLQLLEEAVTPGIVAATENYASDYDTFFQLAGDIKNFMIIWGNT